MLLSNPNIYMFTNSSVIIEPFHHLLRYQVLVANQKSQISYPLDSLIAVKPPMFHAMNTTTFGQEAQGPQRGLYHFLGFLIKDIAVGPQRG